MSDIDTRDLRTNVEPAYMSAALKDLEKAAPAVSTQAKILVVDDDPVDGDKSYYLGRFAKRAGLDVTFVMGSIDTSQPLQALEAAFWAKASELAVSGEYSFVLVDGQIFERNIGPDSK